MIDVEKEEMKEEETRDADIQDETQETAEEHETTEVTEAPAAEISREEGDDSSKSDFSESSSTFKKAKKAPAKKRIIRKQKQTVFQESKPEEPNPGPTTCATPCATPNAGKYLNIFMIIVGVLLVYNIFTLWQTGNSVDAKLAAIEEAAIPLDITVTIITAADCEDCYEIHNLVPVIAKLNVNITTQTEVTSASEEGKALISGYKIEKLPAIILGFDPAMALKVKPEIVKALEALNFKDVDDETDYVPPNTGYMYQAATPPYLDLASGKVKGRVTIISLTAPDCKECQNISSIIPALKKVLTITNVEEIAYDSAAGQQYLNKYGLEFAPTIILSSDAAAYEGFAATWKKYGTEETDGSFVFRNTIPPYLNITTHKVAGLVDITYLTDNSCADCYNVTMHKQILEGFGMKFGTESTVDISSEEGKALLEKYSITKVPTIILSSDAAAYAALGQVWTSVGEIADDGSYIFTAMSQLQGAKYTDVSKSAEPSSTTTSDAAAETAGADGTA